MALIGNIIQILAAVTGILVAFLSIPVYFRFHWPAPIFWMMKLFISAISPWLGFAGLLCLGVGMTTGSFLLAMVGLYDSLFFLIHVFMLSRSYTAEHDFERAFGLNWQNRIHPNQKKYFLRNHFILELPSVPNPQLEQNIPFATIPGSGRKLLCDIWEPPVNVAHSGLAFIYLHGGAWYLLDKDCGTRPFFSHLAAQGHVIMDVAYRFAPETDMMGMIHDVNRAIAWMKENARAYGVDPDRIVLGGGSAGAHLAMMAAYTSNKPVFTPDELERSDVSVRAVISLYGQADLTAFYYHTNQHLTTQAIAGTTKKKVPIQLPAWIKKRMGDDYYRLGMDKNFEKAGALVPLFGGNPDECPETYAFYSPVSHIDAECPQTLILHGEHDMMAPIKAMLLLHDRLVEKKVKTIMHILPQSDHAFDLVLPRISPSAHTAIYDVERFLALLVKSTENINLITEKIESYQFNYS